MQEALDWLNSLGLYPKEPIITDGKIRRFTHRGDSKKNAAYCLHQYGGWVRYHKEGVTHVWKPKGSKYTPTEKAEYKRRLAAIDKQLSKVRKAASKTAAELWEAAKPVDRQHQYIKEKDIIPESARQDNGWILIPVYGQDGELKAVQRINEEGRKWFTKGGEVGGAYNTLWETGQDSSTIIICEGWATACTLREITEKPVVMAFFASNLPKVAAKFRKDYPDSKIIIAADNDQWSKENAGVIYANKCDGCVVRPVQFPKGVEGKPTDYNDLYKLEGSTAVYDCIFPMVKSSNPLAGAIDDDDENLEEESHYRVLGYNGGLYYYYPKLMRQIVELTPIGHNQFSLLQLAPLKHWKEGRNKGKTHDQLVDELMQECHKKGIFKAEEQVRGRGVWMDGEDVIFNSGAKLYIHGTNPISHFDYQSENIYITAKAIPTPLEPLTSSEAHKLRQLCEMASWKNPKSGLLLAGWIVVSLACGTLKWRPHIWVTGASESGKSTVLKGIITLALGDLRVRGDGSSTEAGLRQSLNDDNKPIVFDEAESETKKESGDMESVLQLSRKASSGAIVIKGTPSGKTQTYYCRSTFCFSGINPAIKHYADETRISLLELGKPTGTQEDFDKWEKLVYSTLTQTYHRKLLGRVTSNLPTLLANCATFARAVSSELRNSRAGDQIGTMLAGLYLLHSTNLISIDDALKFVRENDIRAFTAVDEMKDCERLLAFISSRKIRHERYEETIGEMVKKVIKNEGDGLATATCLDLLRKVGIWPRKESVWVAHNSPQLAELLAGTPWVKWSRSLSDLLGAEPAPPTIYTAGQKMTRGLKIPHHYFTDEIKEGEEDDLQTTKKENQNE